MKLLLFILAILICQISSFAQDLPKKNSWRLIIPLKSTVKDVESLMGPPTKIDGNERYYDTSEKERVTVWFSGEPDNSSCKWNVADGVVVRMIVSPRKRLLLSHAGFDLSVFKKEQNLDDGTWIYVQADKGILINAHDLANESGDRMVVFIEFFPTPKEKKERCLPR